MLRDLAHSEGERLSLDQALAALGDRSYGGVVLVLTLAALCLPPGLSAAPGAPLALVGVQLLIGRGKPWVPQFVRARSLDRRRAGRALSRVQPIVARLERYLRPRLPRLLRPLHLRLVGLGCLLLSLPMIVPVPLVHAVAGLGLIAFGAGLVAGDGAALLAGWGMTLVCGGVAVAEAAAAGTGAHLL